MRFKLSLRLSEILPLPPLLGHVVLMVMVPLLSHTIQTHSVLLTAVADLWNKQSGGKTHSKQTARERNTPLTAMPTEQCVHSLCAICFCETKCVIEVQSFS